MGYEKNVYETTWLQSGIQLCVYTLFYGYHAFVLWGFFVFGMWKAYDYTVFAGCIFIFGLVIMGILVYVGWLANRKKHLEEFLKNIVSEQKQKKMKEENDAALLAVKQATMDRMKSQMSMGTKKPPQQLEHSLRQNDDAKI